MPQDLEKRLEMICEQLNQVRASVVTFTENLNQAKAQELQLQGHFNEANSLMGIEHC